MRWLICVSLFSQKIDFDIPFKLHEMSEPPHPPPPPAFFLVGVGRGIKTVVNSASSELAQSVVEVKDTTSICRIYFKFSVGLVHNLT